MEGKSVGAQWIDREREGEVGVGEVDGQLQVVMGGIDGLLALKRLYNARESGRGFDLGRTTDTSLVRNACCIECVCVCEREREREKRPENKMFLFLYASTRVLFFSAIPFTRPQLTVRKR